METKMETLYTVHHDFGNGGIYIEFARENDGECHYYMTTSMSNMGYKVSSRTPLHTVELVDGVIKALLAVKNEMENRKDTFVPTYLGYKVETDCLLAKPDRTAKPETSASALSQPGAECEECEGHGFVGMPPELDHQCERCDGSGKGRPEIPNEGTPWDAPGVEPPGRPGPDD